MTLDPALLHPRVRASPDRLTPPERIYLDTLQALADSLRSPEEMREAADVLNPMLDVRSRLGAAGRTDLLARLDEAAQTILKAACGARDATSGMGCDLALDRLRFRLDEAQALMDRSKAL